MLRGNSVIQTLTALVLFTTFLSTTKALYAPGCSYSGNMLTQCMRSVSYSSCCPMYMNNHGMHGMMGQPYGQLLGFGGLNHMMGMGGLGSMMGMYPMMGNMGSMMGFGGHSSMMGYGAHSSMMGYGGMGGFGGMMPMMGYGGMNPLMGYGMMGMHGLGGHSMTSGMNFGLYNCYSPMTMNPGFMYGGYGMNYPYNACYVC